MMNKIIIMFLIGITLFSCRKIKPLNIPEMDNPPIYFGESSFYLNGVEQTNFLPLAGVNYSNIIGKNITLDFVYYDNRNFARKGIAFNPISFKDTTYNIKTSKNQIINNAFDKTSSFFSILGGDVVLGYYDVDSTKPCVLNITRVDSATKELWGTFYGTYKYPDNLPPPNNGPRVIEITNGSFHTKVLE